MGGRHRKSSSSLQEEIGTVNHELLFSSSSSESAMQSSLTSTTSLPAFLSLSLSIPTPYTTPRKSAYTAHPIRGAFLNPAAAAVYLHARTHARTEAINPSLFLLLLLFEMDHTTLPFSTTMHHLTAAAELAVQKEEASSEGAQSDRIRLCVE